MSEKKVRSTSQFVVMTTGTFDGGWQEGRLVVMAASTNMYETSFPHILPFGRW